LASNDTRTATLVVTIEHLTRGTTIANGYYGVSADELAAPIMGMPVEATVPWRLILPVMFREWVPEGDGDG
jgi:hypothetical protein